MRGPGTIDKKSPKPARVSSAATMPRLEQSCVPPVKLMYFLSVECSPVRRSSPRSRVKSAQRRASGSADLLSSRHTSENLSRPSSPVSPRRERRRTE
eukprot:7379688-Prymnesium_polylepis.3